MARGKASDVPSAMEGRTDARILHFWDGARATMNATRPVLDLTEECWDVYLLYDRDARWDGESPPKPTFWMHQLSTPPQEQELDAKIFLDHVLSLVK
jgi:hypothetical protein